MTYEMLAGEPPFTGPNSQAIVAKVLTEQPPPLRPKRPTVPPAVEAAILTALQKLPADRWGSAKDFGDALAGSATHHTPSAPTIPLASARARPRAGWRSAAFWLGWVVAGLATAIAAWPLRRPREPSFPRPASPSWLPGSAAAAPARRSATWRSSLMDRRWCIPWWAPTGSCT